MHPAIWKAIVRECLVWEQDRSQCAPDFTKEQFADCIIEIWRVMKAKQNAGLLDREAVNALALECVQKSAVVRNK